MSARATHCAIDPVHFQHADFQPDLARIEPTTENRFDTGAQFPDIEWLDEIVVAAGLQPADPFVDRRQSADHQDGSRIAFPAQRLDNRKPVGAVEHPIDDEDRGPPRACGPESVLHAVGRPDRMPCSLEFEAHLVGKFRFVLDQQD